MEFSRQEYWSGLPFPSSMDHALSELSTMTHPSWVVLHGMAHNFIELDKAVIQAFPCNSVGQASTCNAGDPSSIPGSGRSPGEGIGYPLQYTWASLVAQMVKNPPAMQGILVQSVDSQDPLEDSMASHSSILAWRIPMDRGAWRVVVHGVANSWTQHNTAQWFIS